jgi:hypothetical protein
VSVKFAAAFIQSYEEDFFTTSPKVLYRATTESYSGVSIANRGEQGMVGERSARDGGITASISLARVEKVAISLARVPPLVPGRGLVWSAALHVTTIAAFALAPLFFPVDMPVIAPLRGDFISIAHSESISFPNFPRTYDAGSQAAGASKRSGGSLQAKRSVPSHALPARVEVSSSFAPAFSGSVEIVSDLPDATNSVQTIRRPDLPSPRKLKFPQLLQSVVAGPPAEAPPIVAPQAVTTLAEIVAVDEKIIVRPSLVVPPAQRHAKEVSPKAPKVNIASAATPSLLDVHPRVIPALRMEVQTIATKTAVIINAITVPIDTPVKIPDAELSGSFAVRPTSAEPSKMVAPLNGRETGDGPKSATTNTAKAGDLNGKIYGGSESPTSATTDKASGPGGAGAGTLKGSGAVTGIGTGAGPASGLGNASGGFDTGNGVGPGSVAGAGTHPGGSAGSSPGTGDSRSGTGMPGITIMGGSGGRSGRPIPSAPTSMRPGYNITIISGGSSGGASRDAGIFSRSETVYSVYIHVNDASGSADWSMQYALFGRTGGSGMLTPPIAVKKVAAWVPSDSAQDYHSRIFIKGMISATGELTGLQAIRPMDDVYTKSALTALQQWQFLPAELDGGAVPTKVLIGVTLVVR